MRHDDPGSERRGRIRVCRDRRGPAHLGPNRPVRPQRPVNAEAATADDRPDPTAVSPDSETTAPETPDPETPGSETPGSSRWRTLLSKHWLFVIFFAGYLVDRREVLAEGNYAQVSKHPDVVEAYLGTAHA